LSPLEWDEVEVEPSLRYRELADGRRLAESRLIVSKEMMEQMWQGYRCAHCLEDVSGLGAFPDVCPLCNFPIASLQRQQLEQDFVGELAEMRREGWIEREEAFLEEKFHQPKPQIHVRRDP
jgi:hypothetical protein